MTILEIVRYYNLNEFTPYAPFVYMSYPALRSTADWWTVTFGALGDDSTLRMNISALVQKPSAQYTLANTLADCITQPLSFFWDASQQILYIHVSQNIIPSVDSFLSGVTSGFTDRGVAYIDDLLYKPLLKSIPSLAQQADLKEYDQMAFISGSALLTNQDGQFDDIIDDAIHGNDVFIYYLEAKRNTFRYTRSEMLALASLYVENYRFTLGEFELMIQDKRKAANADLLSLDADGNPIPLLYGQIRGAKAQVADDSGVPVVYKLAPNMTNLGTIQCKGDYGWSTVAPISSDLASGTFTVSSTYARSPGNGLGEDTGSVLECRLINPVGIANASAADVIKDMNQRILGIEYTSSNYDQDNWVIADALLAPIGVLFTSQVKLYDAIAKIQNACNLGFRYDIAPTGKRRIIFDDWTLDASYHVTWNDIKDNLTLSVVSDSTLLAATSIARYLKDYTDDSWLAYKDDSKRAQVESDYRQTPTLTIDTFLVSEADAQQRALFASSRFSKVLATAELTLNGRQWYALQIYDIITIELELESRRYFGTWKAQVIAVDPQFGSLETKISAVLIERIV